MAYSSRRIHTITAIYSGFAIWGQPAKLRQGGHKVHYRFQGGARAPGAPPVPTPMSSISRPLDSSLPFARVAISSGKAVCCTAAIHTLSAATSSALDKFPFVNTSFFGTSSTITNESSHPGSDASELSIISNLL